MDQRSTPERRAAAPFLNCFQLQPLREPKPTFPDAFLRVLLYDPPPVTIINNNTYRIIDTALVDTSDTGRLSKTMEIPIYDPVRGSDTFTLWRIRRSPGFFMACAAVMVPGDVGNLKLCDSFWRVYRKTNIICRGLTYEDIPLQSHIMNQFYQLGGK